MMRLTRISFLYAFALMLGSCVSYVSAQATIPSETANPKLTNKARAKAANKLDRRYAIAQGNWSAATIALFNTWMALDHNPGRYMTFYSPDRLKLVEVIEDGVGIRVGERTFDTDINNITMHDAELGWSPDSSKFFVTWSEGEELGPWHMQVYGVDRSGIHEFPKVEEPARKDFERRVRHWPVDPTLNTPELKSVWTLMNIANPTMSPEGVG